jgi:LmbE family N-acetylglucosaminyl deacetylase
MNPTGPILGVWAHPDDEVYLSGGLMASAVRSGRHVVVAMATDGATGTADPETWPPPKLGPLRRQELRNAMSALGVSDIRWLGYEDGTCPSVPDENAVEQLSAIMSEVSPEWVLTFGPDGMTGHEDHIAVSRWTTMAFDKAAPRGAKLYYAAAPMSYFDKWRELFEKYNVFYPGYPHLFPDEELVLTYEVPLDLMTLKRRAIRAHASQVDGFIEEVGEELFMSINVVEWFRLGAEKLDQDPSSTRHVRST